MRTLSSAAAIAAIVFSCGTLRAKEEAVPLDKLPKNITDAVMKKFPSAKLVKASMEKEKDGDTDYEVAITDGAAKLEVTVTDKGELESYEKEIDVKDLPKAVAAALDKAYPNATIKVVEAAYEVEKGKDDLEYYEIELTGADKKEVEARFKPDGSVAKGEADEAKEEKESGGKTEAKK
jgi:Putative beta-lactamase-inhibitor-like, PepSY-like